MIAPATTRQAGHTAGPDTRVTGWQRCVDGPWYPSLDHGGYVAYRIWQQFDGLRWFQRHEWRRADGSLETNEWIIGAPGWCPDAEQIQEAA